MVGNEPGVPDRFSEEERLDNVSATRSAPGTGLTYPELERRGQLDPDEFHREYVGKRPVIFTDAKRLWGPIQHWTLEYFRQLAGHVEVKYRPGYKLGPHSTERLPLRAFLDAVADYERDRAAGTLAPGRFPPYLHDTPMLEMAPALSADLAHFPSHYLPRWYHRDWARFLLFFIGPSDTLTPLHFDTCETNNLFFQVVGRKRFIVVPPERRDSCYAYDWRWSKVRAESPDYDAYPRFRDASPFQCEIGPGEILYIPPGAFHEVRALEPSISFNLDWHTRRTAFRGTAAVMRGMPLRYAFYNVVHAIGMAGGIPCRWVYPLLRLHLSVVD